MIALVTDSTAYLTLKEAREMNVRLIPLSYTVDGHPYNETFADQNGQFEQVIARCNECRVTTSQITLPVFFSTFEELLQQGYDILCVTISSRLSGTYSNASLAARSVSGSGRIRIVDGLSTAGGTYLMLRHAKALIEQGLSLEEVAQGVRVYRERTGIVFSVSDMAPLRRSGRLGIVRQSVGTILNIRPILHLFEGGVVSDGLARGRQDQIKQMVSRVPKDARRLIVHAIGEPRQVQRLSQALQDALPAVPLELRQVGPVLGIHLGMDVLGVVWERP